MDIDKYIPALISGVVVPLIAWLWKSMADLKAELQAQKIAHADYKTHIVDTYTKKIDIERMFVKLDKQLERIEAKLDERHGK